MATVVRSLAAKVEVQTREAEQNLDRFRAKLRASDIQLRGASAYQQAGPSPLFNPGAVARQSAAARAIAVQEMFAAQSIGSAIGSRRFGATGIPITSSEIEGLTLRGASGSGSAMQNLVSGAAVGGGGDAIGALAGLGGIKGLNLLLKGGGAVVVARQLERSFSAIADAADRLQDGTATWTETLGDGLRSLPLLGDFTRAFDELGRVFGRGDDVRAMNERTAGTESLTRDLAFRAEEKIKRRELAAGVGETFRMDIEAAQAESLAEQAEQSQRFADLQNVASSAAERYNARVNELRFSLMAGAISQDAFNESMKAANDIYDEQSGNAAAIAQQHEEDRAAIEDKNRAMLEANSLAKQAAMEAADLARRQSRQEGISLDASRIFVGRGASGVGKQIVEDPQFKIANTLLRRIADNIGTARAA